MTPVTDPALLAQLNGSSGLTPVTDPDTLSQLDPQPVTAAGSAKAIATGLVPNFVSGIAGLPGDMSKGMSWLFDKFGPATSPEGQAKLKEFQSGTGYMPGSSDVHSLFAKAGLVHQAQNPVEQHLEDVSSLVGAGLGGPESLGMNLLKRGVLPGVVSDAAGTVADAAAPNTAAGPIARVLGSLVAPTGARSIAKAAEEATPTGEQLLQGGSKGFDSFRDLPFAVKGDTMQNWASTQRAALDARNFDAETAPVVNGILDRFQGGGEVTAKEIDKTRMLLRNAQKLGGDEATAATDTIAALSDRTKSFTPAQTLRGDPRVAQSIWSNAHENYAAGMRAETIDDAAAKAKLAAAGINSGKNAGNKYKQVFTGVLNSEKKTRGFNDAELSKVEGMITDTRWNRLLRNVGNKFGGGGGIGQSALWEIPAAIGAGAGGASSGLPGAAEGGGLGAASGVGLALLGALARRGYNRNVANNVANISQMVRSRSPMARVVPAPSPSLPSWAQRIIMMHAASQAGRNGS